MASGPLLDNVSDQLMDEEIVVAWPRLNAKSMRRKTKARVALMAASSLLATDPLINSYVLPGASEDIGMSTSQTALAASISTILLVATLLAVGVAGDRSGRRRVLLLGLVSMLVGTVVCTLSVVPYMFIGGRCLTGIGIAAVYAMSLSMIPTITARKDLPKAYGYMFAAWGVMTGVAAILTILVLGAVGWRAANCVDTLVILLILILVYLTVPESKSKHRRAFDTAGVILAAVALVSFILALGRVADQSGLDSVSIFEFVLAVCAGLIFLVVEKRLPSAAFPIALVAVPMVAAACIAVFAINLALGSVQIELPRTVLTALDGPSSTILVLSVPLLVGQIVGSLGVARIIAAGKHIGLTLIGSMCLVAAGMVMVSSLDSLDRLVLPMIGMLLVGMGAMAVITVASVVIMSNAPPDQLSSVGILKPMSAQLGFAIGVGAVIPIATIYGDSKSSNPLTNSALEGFTFALIMVAVIIVLLCFVVGFVLASHKKRGARAPGHLDSPSELSDLEADST